MLPLLLLCILISVYSPAEVCGALYVLKSEGEVQLKCNRSFKNDQPAAWYQTREEYTYQVEKMNNSAQCVSNKVRVPGSGVFACHSSTGTDLCSTAPRPVDIDEICEYDFFIVTKPREDKEDGKNCADSDDKEDGKDCADSDDKEDGKNCADSDEEAGNKCADSSAQRTHEEERAPTPDSSDVLKTPERTNITLFCHFTTNASLFILYWIRAAEQSQCLYSVAGAQSLLFNEHCCVHVETVRRIYNHSDKHISAKIQKHNIEIRNATSSDSGQYLCIGARLIKQTYQWEIVRNISLLVETKNGTKGDHEGPQGNDSWKPILIAVGSVALISGLIVCLILLMRNKSKGKEVTGSSSTRNPGTLENDECSPYAVGMKDKADSAPEPYYASVKTPCAPEYSLLEANTVTAPKSKPETSTVYALAQM